MKKGLKGLLGVVLAVNMLITGVFTVAGEENINNVYYPTGDVIQYALNENYEDALERLNNGEEVPLTELNGSVESKLNSGSVSDRSTADVNKQLYYYLNDAEKIIYDALQEQAINSMDGTLTMSVNMGSHINDQYNISRAIIYMWYDNPMYFWLDINKMSVGKSPSAGMLYYMPRSGYDNYLIDGLTADMVRSQYQQCEDKVKEVIDSVPESADTVYEKIEYLNEWICGNMRYNEYVASGNSSQANECAWNITGGLLYGMDEDTSKNPVCQAYAFALKEFCNQLDISCAVVISIDHMWNYVQAEDGNWYAVDSTWNDPIMSSGGDNSRYWKSYLMVGSSSVVNGEAFVENTSHQEESGYGFPALSVLGYILGIGDVNSDGVVDIFDATAMAKNAIGGNVISIRGLFVADVNDDGVIDVYDATAVAKTAIGA